MRTALCIVAGTGVGMIAVSCWIGGVIGWQQSDQWPAWLTVPLGVGMGPMYLIFDVESLAQGKFHELTALPQALLGGLVGGLSGWLFARRR